MALVGILLGFQGCENDTGDLPLDEIEIDFRTNRLDLDMLEAARQYQSNPQADSSVVFDQFFKDDQDFLVDWFFYGNDTIGTDSALTVIMSDFLTDSNALNLLEEVATTFPASNEAWSEEIEKVFKRIHYYLPNHPIPVVVTFADGYPRSIQQGLEQFVVTPKYLGVGLHYLMGADYQYYPPDLPRYLSRRFNLEHLPAQVAHKYADLYIPEPRIETNPVLIDRIVQQGLQMHFVDLVIGPSVPDSVKLFYTTAQIDWADTYEARAYKDIVPVLYDVNSDLMRRYIDDSPFTSQLNRKSAPRLGQYLGWKIIQTYVAKYPDEPFNELIQRTDYRQIFQQAGYRPG